MCPPMSRDWSTLLLRLFPWQPWHIKHHLCSPRPMPMCWRPTWTVWRRGTRRVPKQLPAPREKPHTNWLPCNFHCIIVQPSTPHFPVVLDWISLWHVDTGFTVNHCPPFIIISQALLSPLQLLYTLLDEYMTVYYADDAIIVSWLISIVVSQGLQVITTGLAA